MSNRLLADKTRLWFGDISGAQRCTETLEQLCERLRGYAYIDRQGKDSVVRAGLVGPLDDYWLCHSALRACCPRLITRPRSLPSSPFCGIRALRTHGQMRFRAASAPSAAGNAGTAPFADACGPHPSFSSFRSRRPGNRRSHLPRTARQKPVRALENGFYEPLPPVFPTQETAFSVLPPAQSSAWLQDIRALGLSIAPIQAYIRERVVPFLLSTRTAPAQARALFEHLLQRQEADYASRADADVYARMRCVA